MLGLMDVKSRFNHALARLDAREALPHVAPLKRIWVPVAAAGLGGALVLNNQGLAASSSARRKVLIRDLMVMGGTLGGLILGWKFAASRLANKMAGGIGKLIGQQPHVHEHVEEIGGKLVKTLHHGHHGHDHFHPRLTIADRISNLFKPQLCDHGAEGFIKLESIAAGSILGGATGGLAADLLNGENVKETAGIKIKEGVFQFLGNITFCTIAILAFSTAGKKIGRALAETQFFKNLSRKGLARNLETLGRKEAGNLTLMPASLTNALETILLDKKAAPEKVRSLAKLLANEVPHTPKADRIALVENLRGAVEAGNVKEVHRQVRLFVTAALKEDIKTLGQKDLAPELAGEFEKVALVKSENRGQLIGVLLGLFTGVVGGAWASNKVNALLTDQFGLPKGHKVGLFSPPGESHHHSVLGERSIHWWDAILHLDDWPSALYLAGVQSLESIIGILYGISGYLTGVAGTDYSARPAPLKHPELYRNHAPLNRQRGVYQSFQLR